MYFIYPFINTYHASLVVKYTVSLTQKILSPPNATRISQYLFDLFLKGFTVFVIITPLL